MRAMSPRWAYLGPEGTFTEAALRAFDGGRDAQAIPFPTIQATLDAVRDGTAACGVVPIENSVEGAVTATLDELASGADLIIRAEVLLPIAFALLARPGTEVADIKTVGSHPVAQPQCRRWLAANLPDAEWRPTGSNADAAQQAAAGDLDAALAGAFAADMYGLAVLAADIHDNGSAMTRFVSVSLPGPLPAPSGADRTSVVAFLADDHPGALMEILDQFAVRGVNLTRIESRPTGDGLGRYWFCIDCAGHVAEARIGEALMGLHRICSQVRFLGSYPRRDGEPVPVSPATSDAAFADAAAWLAELRGTDGGSR
jgi:prephenate dehydratase